mmetsp:Transcript_14789/g.33958  ORF Transcript_14789/g.33958 Transcript_14789/m.33958 type:complete len:81 (-) Transcript_14789:206-448(-)
MIMVEKALMVPPSHLLSSGFRPVPTTDSHRHNIIIDMKHHHKTSTVPKRTTWQGIHDVVHVVENKKTTILHYHDIRKEIA